MKLGIWWSYQRAGKQLVASGCTKSKEERWDNQRYRTRLVAKGFAQKEGMDFFEVFAPVVKLISIRLVLSLVAMNDLELEQLDVKTTFLHGDLEEEVYMYQPQGFIEKDKEHLVFDSSAPLNLTHDGRIGKGRSPRRSPLSSHVIIAWRTFAEVIPLELARNRRLGGPSSSHT
uniref:Reverse transcriptase Ty1/copia-type domain-containing protein n=1 Tax=Ananas comosus var. bracteatus TaxID=296719 RepID=A0A6V7PFF2_ANACO|nr:unnamed protein product [Ananas comosus var. bracteatus]